MGDIFTHSLSLSICLENDLKYWYVNHQTKEITIRIKSYLEIQSLTAETTAILILFETAGFIYLFLKLVFILRLV